MPEVTVLMAVYNGMPYLPLAIESILKQTFAAFEFLIVNDCSTDNTREIILSYDDPRIRLLDNPVNIRQTRSLNRGLEYANTEFVARMDADDISHPKRLEMQVAYLREHPDIAVVGTNIRFIDQKSRIIREYKFPADDLPLRWMQLFFCPVSNGASMFRKSVIWDKLGGFDPSFSIVQDWELWSRSLTLCKIANLSDFLLNVRKHSGASSITFRKMAHEERKRVNRSNPQRVLGIKDDSVEWMSKIDTLIEEHLDHPEYRADVIKVYFERYCELYPVACQDPEVLAQLALQFLLTIYFSKTQRLPQAFRKLWSIWPMSVGGIDFFRYAFMEATRILSRRVKQFIL